MATSSNYYAVSFRICVDENKGGRISGRVLSRRLTHPIAFGDITSLILQLDDVLDKQKFPLAFERSRSFTSASQPTETHAASSLDGGMTQEQVDEHSGAKNTLLLTITTRRSSTWQGRVDWLDGSPADSFTSVLDLLKKIVSHSSKQ